MLSGKGGRDSSLRSTGRRGDYRLTSRGKGDGRWSALCPRRSLSLVWTEGSPASQPHSLGAQPHIGWDKGRMRRLPSCSPGKEAPGWPRGDGPGVLCCGRLEFKYHALVLGSSQIAVSSSAFEHRTISKGFKKLGNRTCAFAVCLLKWSAWEKDLEGGQVPMSRPFAWLQPGGAAEQQLSEREGR